MSISKSECSVADCARAAIVKGLCQAHNARLSRSGNLREDIPLRKSGEPPIELFCAKCGIKFGRRPSEVTNIERSFCSRRCYSLARQESSKFKVYICKYCNAPFERAKESFFCSRACAGKARVAKMERKCSSCDKVMLVNPSKFKEKGNYCSFECANSARRGENNCICLRCGKGFHSQPALIQLGGGKYCSKTCQLGYSGQSKVEVSCCICNKKFTTWKYRIISSGKLYCSRSCSREGQRLAGYNGTIKKMRMVNKNKPRVYHTPNVICDPCHYQFYVHPSRLKSGKGKSCSKQCAKVAAAGRYFFTTRDKSVARKELHKAVRNIASYRRWRKAILERDGNMCVDCNSNVRLEVDHIKPFYVIMEQNKIKNIQDALLCRELWQIENGQTLCRPCHKKKPTFGRKAPSFMVEA